MDFRGNGVYANAPQYHVYTYSVCLFYAREDEL